MAIDFPNSPTLNQVYTVGGTSWTYDGEKWLVSSAGLVGPAGPSTVVVADTVPTATVPGTLWYNSTNGKTYAYYTDSTSSQWVEVGNADPTFNTLTTKGDIVTRSSSAISRLGVGTNNQVLVADSTQTTGMKWGTSPAVTTSSTRSTDIPSPYEGMLIFETDTDLVRLWNGTTWYTIASTNSYYPVQEVYFTSTGTFSKATYPWLKAIKVKLVGGGGGSSGCEALSAGSGGGGGGYAESFITDITGLASSVTVTVGTGGAGGAAGLSGDASAGGTSSFGSLVSATGGGGGTRSGNPSGGSGGIGTVGQLLLKGSGGGSFNGTRGSGVGGSSFFGGGGAARFKGNSSQMSGESGSNYGGGASGPSSVDGTIAGSAGGPGIVILELFA
jgi:hypothetical protein